MAQPLVQRPGAVVAAADGDAARVEDLHDVVRVHAGDVERDGRSALDRLGRAEDDHAVDAGQLVQRVGGQCLLVRGDRLHAEAREVVDGGAEAGKVSERALRVVSVVALVTAVLVHSVTAWIFGLEVAREAWHTAILAPIFALLFLKEEIPLNMIVGIVCFLIGSLCAILPGILAQRRALKAQK